MLLTDMVVFAAGVMHYKKTSKTYSILPLNGVGADKPLYVEKNNQCLLNEFGIYMLDELCNFQNMGTYQMPDPDKLDKFMETRYPGIGTEDNMKVDPVCLISKELLAYIDTLLFVACFYKASDPRVISKIQEQYETNLKRYADVTVDNLHQYIKKKMTAWLTRFPHKTSPNYDASRDVCHVSDEEGKEETGEPSSPLEAFQVSSDDEGGKISGSKGSAEQSGKSDGEDSDASDEDN